MSSDGFSRRAPLSRRTFLQAAGFTLAVSALGCSRPEPSLRAVRPRQPPLAAPGTRIQYATTCGGCSAGCGVLASVRDGRPVKLEGLPGHPVSGGALCAAGQASILGLYDAERLTCPRMDGEPVSWSTLDARLRADIAAAGGAVRVLTGTDAAASPTTRRQIDRFLGDFADGRHDVCDVLSCSAIAEAHEATHGVRAVPRMRFDRAEIVVGFAADFLGTWISPVEFSGQYARARPGRHVQFESVVTLTGCRADRRIVTPPDMLGATMAALYRSLAERAGLDPGPSPARPATGRTGEEIPGIAARLWRARGRALVVCGSADPALQRLANGINELLWSYGATLDLTQPSRQRLGNDKALETLLEELAGGQVGTLVVSGVNPAYALGSAWRAALMRVPVLVAATERLDETSSLARFVCPVPHPLESWGDYEPVAGTLCLRQPVAAPAGETRTLEESLAAWMHRPADALELVRRRWRDDVFDPVSDGPSFDDFWDRSVREGWIDRAGRPAPGGVFTPAAVDWTPPATERATGTLNLVGYPSPPMLDGRQGYNPWLLELPDPVTRTTWDSCASLSPATARALGLGEGDIVRIETDRTGGAIEVPVVVQPGQDDSVVAVPLGYGQMASARFANLGPTWIGRARTDENGDLVGANVAPLLAAGHWPAGPVAARLAAVGRHRSLARAQLPERLQPMDGAGAWGSASAGVVVQVAGADIGSADVIPGVAPRSEAGPTLWGDHPYPGPRWGMVIDLDACTGCGACVVACQAENNTPVVGRDEMRRQRGMHWLRVDRHLLGGDDDPAIAFQPVTCHHCGRAPCEAVCPVLATTHSSDGLNQQVYSRCVGTRYCMNNCPLKVRRFNWFDYARAGESFGPALNPEVTVRSRGVAEKCTFCVQRIQEARLVARQEGRPLQDGDVTPACAQTCPASAISFGDLNDPQSQVSRRRSSPLTYSLFEDMGLLPAVHYQAVVDRGGTDGDEGHEA